MCCCAIEKFGYIVGTFSGKIVPIKGSMMKPIEAHQGKVYCIFYDQKSKKVLTGGADGLVNVFNVENQGVVFERKFITLTNKESVCPSI